MAFHRNRVIYQAADGAVDPSYSHVVYLTKAGVCAATLAAPDANDDGVEIMVIAATANAHTLTYTTGFNGGGAALDVGTFGGAIGDNIVIIAYQGTWYVKSSKNVTLA